MHKKFEINNRKARFNYDVVSTVVAGLCLTGSEIKSIRMGNCSISEAFCIFKGNEVFLSKSYVKKLTGNFTDHNEYRERKLLLNKREIARLIEDVRDPGMVAVPLKVFEDDHGRAKALIAVCKGKKDYDKRESIKKRDVEREAKRKF